MLFEESRPRKHRQGGNSIHILKSRQERAPLAPWLMMIARFCSVLRILPFTKEKEALGKPFWTVWNSNTHTRLSLLFSFSVGMSPHRIGNSVTPILKLCPVSVQLMFCTGMTQKWLDSQQMTLAKKLDNQGYDNRSNNTFCKYNKWL